MVQAMVCSWPLCCAWHARLLVHNVPTHMPAMSTSTVQAETHSGLPRRVGHAAPSPPPPQVPKADVVIAGYEHVMSDLAVLKALPWQAIVVDLRQRCRGVTGRSSGVLAELGGHRRSVGAAGTAAAGSWAVGRLATTPCATDVVV